MKTILIFILLTGNVFAESFGINLDGKQFNCSSSSSGASGSSKSCRVLDRDEVVGQTKCSSIYCAVEIRYGKVINIWGYRRSRDAASQCDSVLNN